MDINTQIADKAKAIDEMIKAYLPKEEGFQQIVIEAMNYSMLAGGKRLRPMLMQETYSMFGGKGTIIEPFMIAMEMIHTYSLVHDDLPCMDNDEYRRGRKTTHVVYGEGMAVLAGDGLLNFAFETAMKAFDSCQVDGIKVVERYDAVARALQVLATKAGLYGMIGGQTADIQAEERKSPIVMEELLFIHKNKTAALIEASMMIGAILAGAQEQSIEAVERCAYNVGIAFQIQDDILDIVGDANVLGKAVGSDEKNSKQTYVTINGMEKSKADVEKMSAEAIGILDNIGGKNEFLKALILHLIHRDK